MNSNIDDNELVSALADGQLAPDAARRGLQALERDPQARERWEAYHLIGDVLRDPELARAAPSGDFMQRLSQRLAAEPAPVAVAPVAIRQEAANASQFRWKRVAALASFVAVAAAGWVVAGAWLAPQPSQLANAPLPGADMVLTGTDKGPMLRDARLDELLAAHRQLGGATALQAPAGGLHNATFEPPSR